jgi:hypothetical protein
LEFIQAVDLEGNPQFHCSTLHQYTKITVLSDCGKTVEELEKQGGRMPNRRRMVLNRTNKFITNYILALSIGVWPSPAVESDK